MYNLCGNLRTCCITQRAPVGVNNNNVNIERCFMGKGAEGQSSDWSQEDVASYQLLFSNYMKYLLSGYWLKHQEYIVYFGILLPESACPSFRHKKKSHIRETYFRVKDHGYKHHSYLHHKCMHLDRGSYI